MHGSARLAFAGPRPWHRSGNRIVIGSLTTPALKAPHLGHFWRPAAGVSRLVHDAHAAFLGEGNGEARLRHRVHGGGQQRDIQLDGAREAGGEADFAGRTGGVGGTRRTSSKVSALDDAHARPRRKERLYRLAPARTTKPTPALCEGFH